MANSISHAGLPYPIRKARFSVEVMFRVAAGTPTDPSAPDTELSVDGGASFSDAAEEITTGGSNGAGYITLTGAEMDNPSVVVAAKSANCVTTPMVLRPRNLAIVGSGTLSAGSAGGGTLGTLLAYDVTGCFIRTTGGTGGGGTGGANNQARRIITYDTSTGAFTVSPNWETTPSTDTTYDVLLPEGVTLGMLRALNPATPGRKAVVDADGLIDANAVKIGPTGSGTAQTAGDLAGILGALNTSASVGDPGTTTTLVAYIKQIINTLEGSTGIPTFPAAADAGNNVSLAEVLRQINARIVGTLASGTHQPQSGDAYAVVNSGTHGNAALKTLIDLLATASALQTVDDNVDTLLSRLTASRAVYLDNLNVGGAVASQADITAINQSASRRILLTTVGQYERPESGSTTYTIEARTFDGDGAAINADSDPTLTGTGQTSGSLAANIGSITNPATGVYRWAYTVSSGATIEPARFDVSATIGGSAFTLSVYTQVVDLVGTTFTTADRTKIEAVYNKLPSKDYLAGTANSDGDVQMNEATGNFPGSVASVAGAVGSVTGNVGGNVAGSVGSVTAGVTLADDAISAGKFDETTAFPLKAADTGATTVARVGADGDTLETLSDQLDAIPTTIRLKKNTAFNNFTFPMLDTAGDPATGATVTGQVALDGGTFANLTNSVSELSSGVYKVNLAAADLNGNDAMLKFTASGCKTLFIKVVLQP